MRERAGIIFRVGHNLRDGLVTRRLHELLELTVGHRGRVDPESIDRDPVRRRLLGIVMIRTHAEGTAGNPDHVRGAGAFLNRVDPPDFLVQHRDHWRAASLLAVIPESLRTGRVGVVPAHAWGGSCSSPGNSGRSTHEANRRTGGDGAAPRPAVRAWTYPAASSRDDSGIANGDIAARTNARGAAIGCTPSRTARRAAAMDNSPAAPPDRGAATMDNGSHLDTIARRLVTGLCGDRSRRCEIQSRSRCDRHRSAQGRDKKNP